MLGMSISGSTYSDGKHRKKGSLLTFMSISPMRGYRIVPMKKSYDIFPVNEERPLYLSAYSRPYIYLTLRRISNFRLGLELRYVILSIAYQNKEVTSPMMMDAISTSPK